MYDFVDRPVAALAPGGRFLLYVARGWIRAATAGTCPPGTLAPVFARLGVLAALSPFHTLMAQFNARARQTIAFAPLGHRRIAEDEAILLQLCRQATESPLRAKATLSLLIDDEAVGNAFCALLAVTARLRDGGLGEMGLAKNAAAPKG